jgi:serralysin
MATAISATAFIDTLGVNTHLDFGGTYADLTQVESNLEYLGLPNVRDSAETASDAQTWLQVAQATGVKFDDYIAETSQAGMQTDISYMTQLADEGILNAIEGGDEEDDSYPQSLGNTLAATAQVQEQLSALGQQLGLPVINMSFGSGWTAANDWEGDYGSVGNLSAYATYANAHTYPNPGQLPDSAIEQLNSDAKLAASSRPVLTTEIGWTTTSFSQATIAQYVVDATFDGIADGDAGMYFYALYDDSSGDFGLFNSNGTARPAATALHDLTTLLADTGSTAGSFTPGSLNYTLSGTQTTDNSILIEKSNGSFWIGLWNEGGTTHTVTVTLPSVASEIEVFDPITGTSEIESASNASSISVSLGADPLLIEIVGVSASSGTTTTSGGSTTTPTGPSFTAPGSETATTGGSVAVTGVSVTDAFAAANPGTMVLDVSDTSGLLAMTSGGTKLAGSGTHSMSVTGTLAQINADLATLSYTAGSSTGGDTIAIDVWDQAGLEGSKTIEVTVSAPTTTTTTTTTPTGPTIAAPASESFATGSDPAITGVSVTDAFAASNPGSLVLDVSATSGDIAMTSGGTLLSGSGTHSMSVTGTLAQINADLATLAYTAGSSAGTDSINIEVWDQAGIEGSKSIAVTVTAPATTTTTGSTSTGPVITVPASDSVTAGATTTVSGVSVADAFAASNPGSMVLNVGDTTGLIAMTSDGTKLAGSGTHSMSVTGTLAQINADLATLTYTAGSSAGSDSISVNVWDQAGLDSTKTIGVTVSAEPTVTIAASNADPVELVSNTIISATSGNHMFFIGGSGDTITATGGTETVQAFEGTNSITTGAGNDTSSFGGTGNTINAGGGSNTLNDSGSDNTIVMPGAGQGFDNIFGYVLANGDTLDFRAALAETSWTGSASTLGNYLHIAESGANALISLSTTSGGGATQIADLEGAGQMSLSGLLAHSLT